MPTSTISHITDSIRMIIPQNPASILDIGVGYGRWGYLCRETLDAAFERYKPEEWKVQIDGIEIFEPYILPHQRFLYDTIHIGDAADIIKTLGRYDIIIAGDVVEHLPKEKAWDLLFAVIQRAEKGFLLNLPLGEEWLRECPEHENVHEAHLSWWSEKDFEQLSYEIKQFPLANGWNYGLFWFSASDLHFNRSFFAYQNALKEENRTKALLALQECIATKPHKPEPHLLCIDLLIQMGKIDDTITSFDNLLVELPDFYEGYILFLKFLQGVGLQDVAEEKKRYFSLLELPEQLKEEILRA